MHPYDIQAALKKAGWTQDRLAKELGVSPMAISRVISKHSISDYIMRAIAKIIGKPVKKVFPEYYKQPPKRSTSKSQAFFEQAEGDRHAA